MECVGDSWDCSRDDAQLQTHEGSIQADTEHNGEQFEARCVVLGFRIVRGGDFVIILRMDAGCCGRLATTPDRL